MTKVRAPLSIDGALGRIVGRLPGAWKELAAIVGRSEKQARRWGDADERGQIPLLSAIALDKAYEAAGGTDHPLFDFYALQLKLDNERSCISQVKLAQLACVLIRECAQAHEAMVLSSLPAASDRDRVTAIRELEDVLRETTGAIAMLAARATGPPETG